MQPIINIAEICARKSVRSIVLSPGSRCAPLTLAFVRHPEIDTMTISDERSAAFIAMGIALQKQATIGLVCTSGSAGLNYAPAVAEAFYQQIPLIIFTADRPVEWIDQMDGQAIRQQNLFGQNVKGSYHLPADYTHPDSVWYIERILSEAINLAEQSPKGPVHINVPLREPLYSKEIAFEKNVKIISSISGNKQLSNDAIQILHSTIKSCKKVLVVAGQSVPDQQLSTVLQIISNKQYLPVVCDVISNHFFENCIDKHDIFLGAKDEILEKELQPDLLITFGLSVVSKNLKVFLRKNKPAHHWHLQEAGPAADTFQALTNTIYTSPKDFFESIFSDTSCGNTQKNYHQIWLQSNVKATSAVDIFFKKELKFNELSALEYILKSIPDNTILHLANSMTVRYVNYLGLKKRDVEVYCNRGTSGIDGVISTAVGAAMSTTNCVTVITGDLAFFYDRNAFWNNYLPANLRIILLNNHGGGIFRIIDGPNKQPELEEYFETRQPLTAASLAEEYRFEYTLVNSDNEFKKALGTFYDESNRIKILEIETHSKTNTEIFYQFKNFIK